MGPWSPALGLGVAQVAAASLLPVAIVWLVFNAGRVGGAAVRVLRRCHLLPKPRVVVLAGPPVERIAADLRRLSGQLRQLPRGTSRARQQGLLQAYDEVLVTACAGHPAARAGSGAGAVAGAGGAARRGAGAGPDRVGPPPHLAPGHALRLFAAVVPPGSVLDHLDAAVRRVRDRDGAPRWTARDALHLTVAFFGEVEERRLASLTGAMAAARTPPPVRLRFDGAGTFPERGAPRVLWVGVDGDVESLAELSREATAAAARAGVPVRNEGRAYRPHLTVGRWPSAAPADRSLVRGLSGYAGPHFAVSDWRLVRSRPGSVYETLASWEL
jgi:2'-5' RNA ligase